MIQWTTKEFYLLASYLEWLRGHGPAQEPAVYTPKDKSQYCHIPCFFNDYRDTQKDELTECFGGDPGYIITADELSLKGFCSGEVLTRCKELNACSESILHDLANFMLKPLNAVPLYIHNYPAFAKWRLSIAK